MHWFLENAYLIPGTLLASFVLILFFGKRLPRKGSEIGVAAISIAFALACLCAVAWIQRPADVLPDSAQAEATASHGNAIADTNAEAGGSTGQDATAAKGHEVEPVRQAVERSFTWWQSGKTKIGGGILIDGLAVMMLFVVTAISLLVHVYSTSYMHGDRRYTYFYAALSLFTASMLLLVISNNLLQLLVGWELVGLCSFMLIGHWWEEGVNSDAAMKAFFTTRVGDAGLMIGIITLFFGAAQTFNINDINARALGGGFDHTVLLVGAIGLMCGVIGKSAQFPLHTWLPDAMAGPTPVSALIHAATMVVAGVFLIARTYGVFWEAFSIHAGGINFVSVIGGTTVIIAAALAFVQSDIKKVLAYSTVSQLGYMVMALGVGAWTAGILVLFTHAFFKANLFLGAGSVGHAVHSFDMKKEMGGLKKHMPQTYKTFVIGSAALAGFPLLAGFWSKDEILLGAKENGFTLFFWVGVIGAFMTAAYMVRCIYLTFEGEFRGHGHPHESPPAITRPLWILSGASIVAGFLNAPKIELFSKWTGNETIAAAGLVHHQFNWAVAIGSTAVAAVGALVSYAYWYRNAGPHGATERSPLLRGGYAFLDNRYYLDDLYTGVVVGSIKGPIAKATYWTNQNVIDGVLNGAAWLVIRLGRFTYDVVDQKVVDGLVNGAGASAEGSGSLLRTIQTGRVQQYAAVLFAAAALFGVALIFWS
ncbi:MAG: NADH-quinone oxidoreductase subunit [Actinomycetota bacterium]|nr:NADH-quinone oxidoreductase subunit [Actinomycetota bacterium]